MEISLLLSLIALVISVLCPVVTTILTNAHQRKMHRLEFREKHRAEVIEGFLSSVANRIDSSSTNRSLHGYDAFYNEMFFYIKKDAWTALRDLDESLDRSPASSRAALDKLIEELQSDPPRS